MKLHAYTPVYPLPQHEEIVGLAVAKGDKRHLLQAVDHSRMLEMYCDQPVELAGRPLFFSLHEESVYLFPPPEDGWDLTLRYVPAIQEM